MWQKLSGEKLEDSILIAVEKTIKNELKAGNQLKVCIGTDSQEKKWGIDYATVIVFLRKRAGGFMFIKKQHSVGKISIKQRMMTEVAKSIEIAYQMCPILEKYNIDLEVHADINTDARYKSNTALSEAMGYILSMGYSFKAKPEAFASSSCADRFVN